MADTVHVDVCPDCGTASTGHGMDPPGHCPHLYELRVPVLYMPAEVTNEMIEAGARALYDDHMRTASFFREFEEWQEHWESQARLVLCAAFPRKDDDHA